MRCRCNKLGKRNRAWMKPCADKPCYVRDINHYVRAYFIRNGSERVEVNLSRIRARANDNQFGPVLFREVANLVHIYAVVVTPYTVKNDIIKLPREINRASVGQVPAVAQIHAHDGIACLAGRHINRHIRLTPRMRLDVHVLAAEEFLCPLYLEHFNLIHMLATAVVTLSTIT